MGGTCGVAREGEGPQGVSFYSVSSLGSLHLVGSVFICSILSMRSLRTHCCVIVVVDLLL